MGSKEILFLNGITQMQNKLTDDSMIPIRAPHTKTLLEIVSVLVVLSFAGYYAHNNLDGWQPSSAVQTLARASIMWATGYGCHDFADEKLEADLRVLDKQLINTFPNSTSSAPVEKRPLTHLQKTHLYLCYLLGVSWWLFGIHWLVAKHLILAFLIVNALFLYGFCRQSLNRLLSVIVVCLFVISLSHLHHLDLRDVSKAPFYSGTFLLLALLLKRPVRLYHYLLIVASLSVFIGIGLGFRRDMLVLAVFVFPIILFCPVHTIFLRYRLFAAILYCVILALLALPIDAFSFHERGQDNIRIICGFAGESEYFLPLSQASYMKEPLAMNDDYGLIVSQAAAKTGATMPESQYQGLVGTSDADTLYSGAYLNTLLRYFPFDLTVRAFSAVAYIIQGRILQLSGVFKWAMTLTPIIIALLLLMIASRAPWRATLMLYLLLVFCGYVSLQFQPRHYFHLTFIPIWIWALALYLAVKLLHQLLRDRNKEVRFYASQFYTLCKNSASWAAVICLLAASLLYGLYRYQESKVLAIRDAYENADRTLITPKISQWDNNLLLGLDISECTSEMDFLRPDQLIHKTLMIEIECTDDPFILGTSYYGYRNLSSPININKQGVSNGDIMRIYVPAYEWQSPKTPMFFNGFVVSPELNKHVLNIYEVDNDDLLPMVLLATSNEHAFLSNQQISFRKMKPRNIFFDSYRELRDDDYIQIIERQIEAYLKEAVAVDYHRECLGRYPKSIGHYMLLFWTNLSHAENGDIAPLFEPLVKTFPQKFVLMLYAFDLCINKVNINPILLWNSLEESYPESAVINSLFPYALYQTITDRKWHGSIAGQGNEYRSQILHLAKQLLQITPLDVDPALVMGDTLIAINERDTALQVYSAIMKQIPSSTGVAIHINSLFQEKDNTEELYNFWMSIANVHPDAPLPQMQVGIALERSNLHKQATIYYEKAAINYRRLIASDTENLSNHFGLAQSLEALEKNDEALKIYNEILCAAPESPKTAGYVDNIYIKQNRQHELVEFWRRHTETHPEAVIPHLHLGMVLEKTGDYAQAKKHYEAASTNSFKPNSILKNNLEFYTSLAHSLTNLGSFDAALDIYHEIILREPEVSEVAERIDAIYMNQDKNDDLPDLWRKYSEMRPEAAVPHLHLGLALERAGSIVEAQQAYEQAIALDSNILTARCRLGALLMKTDRKNEGEKLLESAIELFGNSDSSIVAKTYGEVARYLFSSGKLDYAEKYYRRAIDLGVDDIGHYMDLAWILETTDNPGAATAIYGKIVERTPENILAAERINAIYIENNEEDTLLTFWEEMVQKHPNAVVPRVYLGMVLEKTNKYAEAEQRFQQALSLDADNFHALLRLGSLQLRQGRVDQGEQLLEHALAQADEESRVTIMHEYGKIARHFFTSNQFEHAIKYYQHAIALGATDLGHYVDLGTALESKGDYEAALALYRQSLERSPDLPLVAFRVDAILYSMEDHEAGVAFWKSMAQQFPEAITPLLHLAMAYEAAGDFQTAKETYKQVLKLAPDNVNALCALGGLLLAESNSVAGMTLIESALTVPNPQSSTLAATAFSKAAQAFYDKAEYGTAAEYYRRAIDLDKTNVGNLALLGKCAEALGDVDEALLLYREVMKRAPESPQTAGQIDALYIRAGRQGEITELWKQYVGLHPKAAIPHLHLGLAFERERLHERSLEELDKALAIDPNLNAAMELRAAIIAKTVQ